MTDLPSNADPDTVTHVGIVGAGAMGAGIAQVTVTGGMTAVIHDQDPAAIQAAMKQIGKRVDRLVEKGQLAARAGDEAKSRVVAANELAGLADCQLVVEAVVEDLEVKQTLFRALEERVSEHAILASNTSSLSIGAIGSSCRRPERVAGMHFFNPVPLMQLVEVVSGRDTSEHTAAMLSAIGRRMGRTPVRVTDSPGFLVNLGGRALNTEALHILKEGVASPAQVDAVMRDCCGFRMGPFELMDLTGIDVNFPASTAIYHGFFHDPRLRTTPLHRQLFDAGRLGRKTGQGFYHHGDAALVDTEMTPADYPVDPACATSAVVLAEPDATLDAHMQQSGARILAQDDGTAPIVASPVGEDLSTLAARTGLDPARLVGIDTTTDFTQRIVVMTAPGSDPATLAAVAARLASAGRRITAIRDSPGFIAQRMRAMVGNLGCEMAQIGLASPEDIDTAMTLGLNYPTGPLALCETVGTARMYTILTRLQEITGDDRYRPSPWLRRRAQLGLPIHTPD